MPHPNQEKKVAELEEQMRIVFTCKRCDNTGGYADHGCGGDEQRCATECPIQTQCDCVLWLPSILRDQASEIYSQVESKVGEFALRCELAKTEYGCGDAHCPDNEKLAFNHARSKALEIIETFKE